tara:strand:- start:1995 stop:2198 length:204 start_codon:yes stop_codon:yes gene_type:complete
MSKCISEYIDDWCQSTFGHTNWEFYNVDNIDDYIEIFEDYNIAVFRLNRDEYEEEKYMSYTSQFEQI